MMKRRPREGIEFFNFLREQVPVWYRLHSLVMLLVGALASSVKAADSTVPPPQPAPAGWLITAGADARAVPRYMGSNASAIVPVPYFDVRRPGSQEGFHTPRDGTGIALFDNGVLAIGPVGSLIWQRRESYSSSLKGLGNVNFTGLIGGFADYWAMPWLRSRVEVLGGFGGATGVMTNLSVDAVIPLSKALTWSGGPRALRHQRVGKPVFQHYARAIDRIACCLARPSRAASLISSVP